MCINMTAAEQLRLAKQYEELWNELLPGFETPGSVKFLLWTAIHNEERVVRGINRASRKARVMQQASTPRHRNVFRYASSVMRQHAEEGEHHRAACGAWCAAGCQVRRIPRLIP
jgi:hypothetical protein